MILSRPSFRFAYNFYHHVFMINCRCFLGFSFITFSFIWPTKYSLQTQKINQKTVVTLENFKSEYKGNICLYKNCINFLQQLFRHYSLRLLYITILFWLDEYTLSRLTVHFKFYPNNKFAVALHNMKRAYSTE